MGKLTRREFVTISATAFATLGIAGCSNGSGVKATGTVSTGKGSTSQSASQSASASTSASTSTATASGTVTSGTMTTFDIVHAKRQGKELSAEHITQLVNDYCAGSVSDAQMSAFMMAVCCNGMTIDEASALTAAMVASGEKLDYTARFDKSRIVDKHSTGGVGDKTSFVIAPTLAALGLIDPMMSGRGLGITGGTLDKLESIPGFNVSLTTDQINAQLDSIGFVMCGQTESIAPADKKMYALRDVTATVDSVPLITSSIMSKKIAEGTKNLVVDLKCGRAAFMTNEKDARELASFIEQVGAANDVQTKCLLTRMDIPLGRCVGNAVEIEEILAILEKGKEATTATLWEDITELGAIAVELTSGASHDEAIAKFEEAITSGASLQKFHDMCKAQGGDLDAFETARLQGVTVHPVAATETGYVADIDAEAIGIIVRDLGGGRIQSTDTVNHQVGITDLVCVGEQVTTGQPLANIRITDTQDAAAIAEKINAAIMVSQEKVEAASVLI